MPWNVNLKAVARLAATVYSWRFVQCCFAFESQPPELRFGDAHQLISRSLTDGRLNKQLG